VGRPEDLSDQEIEEFANAMYDQLLAEYERWKSGDGGH
jgi:hypothetical protein